MTRDSNVREVIQAIPKKSVGESRKAVKQQGENSKWYWEEGERAATNSIGGTGQAGECELAVEFEERSGFLGKSAPY